MHHTINLKFELESLVNVGVARPAFAYYEHIDRKPSRIALYDGTYRFRNSCKDWVRYLFDRLVGEKQENFPFWAVVPELQQFITPCSIAREYCAVGGVLLLNYRHIDLMMESPNNLCSEMVGLCLEVTSFKIPQDNYGKLRLSRAYCMAQVKASRRFYGSGHTRLIITICTALSHGTTVRSYMSKSEIQWLQLLCFSIKHFRAPHLLMR